MSTTSINSTLIQKRKATPSEVAYYNNLLATVSGNMRREREAKLRTSYGCIVTPKLRKYS